MLGRLAQIVCAPLQQLAALTGQQAAPALGLKAFQRACNQASPCTQHQQARRHAWTDAASTSEISQRESFYDEDVIHWAVMPVEPLTLKQMLEHGREAWYDQAKIIESARFVQRELPKRLARRVLDLQQLPYIVVTNPHIKRVYNAYFHGFTSLKDLPPVSNMQQNEAFSQLLRRLIDEHAPMLDALATGLREVRSKPVVGEALQLDAFLQNMLRSRITRRVLAEQHVNIINTRPNCIGIINTELGLADAVEFAAQRVRQACMETYGAAPDVVTTGDLDLRIPYISAHLDYMLFEILKNSSRALVERGLASRSRGGGALGLSDRLPPIHVRICNSDDEATIRISDQGGGIPRQHEQAAWQFGFSTVPGRRGRSSSGSAGDASSAHISEGLGLDSQPLPSPTQGSGASFGAAWAAMERNSGMSRYRMAGLGFGLPLSRLYARYFGGDLRLINMPGYGVDAFLSLRRLGDSEWQEQSVEQQTPVSMYAEQVPQPAQQQQQQWVAQSSSTDDGLGSGNSLKVMKA